MNILQLNKSRRILLKTILENIFSEFDSIKIKRNGIVVFRRRWFYLRAEKIHASELCISEIPKRLSILLQEYNTGSYENYMLLFRENITQILLRETYNNIIDYLYEEFNKFKWDIGLVVQKQLACSRITLYRHVVTKIADLIPQNISYLNSLNDFLWRLDKIIISGNKKIGDLTKNQNILKFFYPELFPKYKELNIA